MGQADAAGLTEDPLAGGSAAHAASAVSITESEGDGGLELDDALASSGLTDSDRLPEAEAVPFLSARKTSLTCRNAITRMPGANIGYA